MQCIKNTYFEYTYNSNTNLECKNLVARNVSSKSKFKSIQKFGQNSQDQIDFVNSTHLRYLLFHGCTRITIVVFPEEPPRVARRGRIYTCRRRVCIPRFIFGGYVVRIGVVLRDSEFASCSGKRCRVRQRYSKSQT